LPTRSRSPRLSRLSLRWHSSSAARRTSKPQLVPGHRRQGCHVHAVITLRAAVPSGGAGPPRAGCPPSSDSVRSGLKLRRGQVEGPSRIGPWVRSWARGHNPYRQSLSVSCVLGQTPYESGFGLGGGALSRFWHATKAAITPHSQGPPSVGKRLNFAPGPGASTRLAAAALQESAGSAGEGLRDPAEVRLDPAGIPTCCWPLDRPGVSGFVAISPH